MSLCVGKLKYISGLHLAFVFALWPAIKTASCPAKPYWSTGTKKLSTNECGRKKRFLIF